MELNGKFVAKAIEDETRKYLETLDLRALVEDETKGKGDLVGYIEGPPTMNGEPHVGHLRGRIIKDLWYRYNVLQKRNVIFRAGWDSQGLPVELQAEKELGLTGNKIDNIRKVGIEKIVATCKKLIKLYNEKWILVDKLLGMSFNYDKSYWTFHDRYIEREWKYLKRAWEDRVLREWYRVVAYCPSCQTSLSNAEVNQGYETVEDPSFYYKVKLSQDNSYLVIWTTMPFTVVTDEMVAVNPNHNYVRLRIKQEEWIVAQDRMDSLMKDLQIVEFSIVEAMKGRDLEGIRYLHPLLSMIPGLDDLARKAKIHMVVAEEFVDVASGSGIVHLSPANGQEDFQIAERRKIPTFVPIDDRVNFTQEAGIFRGLFVRDADDKVIEAMKQAGAYVKLGRIKHQYPTCWRSHHKVVWLARREYFYMIDGLEDKPLSAALKVEYFYDAPKNRYLEIIKEKVPWCISRERIWGAPLPIWACRQCSHKVGLFSRKEIVDKAQSLPDGQNFELHRPQIDRVEIKCEKCGSRMEREPFVLDTWHNSGAAPYASLDDEEYFKLIPAAFMTEGIDQTRGWAYTLLMQNVILTGTPVAPFKSFLFQGHVLDEKGNKMSKSIGNVIDAHTLLNENAVDLIRFYFMWKSSPIESLNFSLTEMATRTYQIMSTLYYLHVYFRDNSKFDKFNLEKNNLQWAIQSNLLRIPDSWVLSKLQLVIKEVGSAFGKCRFHDGAKSIEEFIINTLSQTYVPVTRNEIWDDSLETLPRRLAIYSVLGHVLKQVDIMLHPLSPYISDFLYLACFPDKKSILLEDWPVYNDKLIDKQTETSFNKSREIVSLSNAARMKAKLKRRWPIKKVWICSAREDFFDLDSILEMLKSQINVQDCTIIQFANDTNLHKMLSLLESEAPIVPKISLSKRNIGLKARADLEKVLHSFERVDKYQLLRTLESSGRFLHVYENGSAIELNLDDIVISYGAAEGYTMSEKGDMIVFIESKRDRELITKGLMRDLARNLQQLRKERGYNTTDVLATAYIAELEEEEISALSSLAEELKYLVRVNDLLLSKLPVEGINYKTIEYEGRNLFISL
ncbi:MAG: isoleucine--tRNA ligase [Nitrososphaeraceae archaeon]|nr:isoleucine--tRNA ligase [Nitrososphaeraceae archaeon]